MGGIENKNKNVCGGRVHKRNKYVGGNTPCYGKLSGAILIIIGATYGAVSL